MSARTLWRTYVYCATCDRPVAAMATECHSCGAKFGVHNDEQGAS